MSANVGHFVQASVLIIQFAQAVKHKFLGKLGRCSW